MHHYQTATQLLVQARKASAENKQDLAISLFLLVQDHLDLEPDPIRFLAVSLQADNVVRDLFLPEGEP